MGDSMKLEIPKGIMTRRLLVRPHTVEDGDGFVEFMTDDVATRFLTFDPEQRTAKGARDLLDFVIASYDTEHPVFALAITERSNDAYLGSCGLSPLADEQDAVEVYFSLLPRYWGWGYDSEAIETMLYYAFVEVGAEKVVANIASDHKSAAKVAMGAGLENQGKVECQGIPDCVRYSISSEAYQQREQRMRRDDNDGAEA
jgi:RimJ/RimL family protein N-acetyltransferase